MIINGIRLKFVRPHYLDRGWYKVSAPVHCPVCSDLILKPSLHFYKYRLLNSYSYHIRSNKAPKGSYLLFCSSTCKELFDINPLAYESSTYNQ